MGGGKNTPSGDITIDDVVKFIHDNVNNETIFSYTTWDDIPDYNDANENIVCKTNNPFDKTFSDTLLYVPHYIIGTKAITLAPSDPNV